ncbi:DnaJ like chaperone protein [Rubricella aquisinus]|uniref:DnaJ like chaperone protein n=1 Tax=Rubricella aquisinus TaxID=2028108 RepID=A0A840WRW1_9RHOB|nr:molecular chaperone DjiA [Rubricella aquisinus]MBB5516392.1 DnaJ like chaperone protein [Rubricella aquisinus]
MSIWSRIADAISALASGEGLSKVFERLRTPPERSVAFTIGVIALGAKMAKADGHVSRAEVSAFREVFHIPPEDLPKAAQVFNLARQDVAGYRQYARQIGRMFADDRPVLEDLLEGLMHIAVADGVYHPKENDFLRNVAEAFGIDERSFLTLRARHVPDAERDPHDVLGIEPDMNYAEKRARWRELVKEAHPDRMMARGVPEEAVKLAQARLSAINAAWEKIQDTENSSVSSGTV